MHLADLQVVRPIPPGSSRLGTIAVRLGRLALLYASIAAGGAALAGVVAIMDWRIVAGIGIGIAVSALVVYASVRMSSVTRILLGWSQRGDAELAAWAAVDPPTIEPPTKENADDLPLGRTFAGRYRIESVLGRGAVGVVYKAIDTQLEETVAIKTLPADIMTRSAEDLERFKREIRLARKIAHRNVLRMYDYGETEGVYFISMEFVRGNTLSELIDEAPQRQMPPRAAVGITRQISRGLQAAHEQGIIHRDIKPQNVLIDAKGEAKLMDFGIARLDETPEGVTQAGLIIGTPHYMSPEQVQGKQLDARSDIYSMGVLIYEMLVGRRPFESSSLSGVLTAQITENAKPPIELRPEVGHDLNIIVLRCLMRNPAERYQDAAALLAALEGLERQEKPIAVA